MSSTKRGSGESLAVLSMTRFLGRIKAWHLMVPGFSAGIASVNGKKAYEKDRNRNPLALYIYNEASSPAKDKTGSIGYEQNRWFLMVVMAGLDQIHLVGGGFGIEIVDGAAGGVPAVDSVLGGPFGGIRNRLVELTVVQAGKRHRADRLHRQECREKGDAQSGSGITAPTATCPV